MEKTRELKDYIDLLRRRKLQILIPMGLLFLISGAVAFLIPPAYRSTATILIEEQEVPPDLVRSTVTSYADQRIQTIKHQVMTRSNLWKIVEQYALYPGLRSTRATEEVLKRLVDDIDIEVISAEVVDRRTGHPTNATIALTLSYRGETAPLAQKVANELVSLFLAENLKSRERNAQETTSFLKQEAEGLSGRIETLERRIASFKQRAKGALPELIQFNMQLMNQNEREMINLDQEIRMLDERKIYLEGQLAVINPNTPMMTAGGERILDSGERLRGLRAQYVSSASYLAPGHPDLIKMKLEIEALEKATGPTGAAEEFYKRITAERAELTVLLERYGEDHPDVVRSRRIVSSLEKELAQAPPASLKTPAVRPENPTYIHTQAQLASTLNALDAVKITRAELKVRAKEYADRVERTPMLEREYLDLTRDRDNSVQKYHEIRSKLLEAQVSEGLEAQHKGERFSLVDPPALPEKPEKPNRPAIFFLGIVLAMAGGVGCGAAAESLDHSVRSTQRLAEMTQTPPLAVIPYMPNPEEGSRKVRRRRLLILGGIALMVLSAAAVHFYLMPLDVFWFAGLRKLGIG